MGIQIELQTRDLLYHFGIRIYDPDNPSEQDQVFIKCLLEDFSPDLYISKYATSTEVIDRTIYSRSNKLLIKTDLIMRFIGIQAIVQVSNFILSKKIYHEIGLDLSPDFKIKYKEKLNLRKFLLNYQQKTTYLEAVSTYNQSYIFRNLVEDLIKIVIASPFNLYFSGKKLSPKYKEKRVTQRVYLIFQNLTSLLLQNLIASQDILNLYKTIEAQQASQNSLNESHFFSCKKQALKAQEDCFQNCLSLIGSLPLLQGSLAQICQKITDHTPLINDIAMEITSYLK